MRGKPVCQEGYMSVVFPRELEATYGNGFLIELTERENRGMGMSEGGWGGLVIHLLMWDPV